MNREKRKTRILKRKNFFPTLAITVTLWLSLACLIFFADPNVFLAVPLFFALLFLAMLFTLSLMFANGRRGMVISLGLTFFTFLAYLGVGNYLNLILVVAIAICIEIYFGLR